MKMKRIISIVLAMLLLASAVPTAVMPAAAQQAGIPCDDGDNVLTKDELVNAILPYMLDGGTYTLDEVGDSAWVYAYWGGEPKTIVDSADRTVTIYRPVERIVVPSQYALQTMRSLKLEKDKIVGVDDSIAKEDEFFSKFSRLPSVGKWTLDYEAILSLNPDLMITWMPSKAAEYAEKLPGIPVVGLYCYKPSNYVEEIRKLGYILDKEEEADEFVDFYQDGMDTIKEIVEEIPEEDKPEVYIEWYGPYETCGEGSGFHEKIKMAGGNNTFSDLSGYPEVTAEDVIERNPEIIVARGKMVSGRYNIGTDISDLIDIRSEVMNRLALVDAVENEKVYIHYGDVLGGTRHFVGIGYMAKWFNSTLFKDLDSEAMHQEYLTRFQGLPDDFLDTHGVFVYPEEPI